ncbi:MAG TPA: transmembrane 220 family protein [Kofleriaceae bacterium]|nr:transmembrane 220 family protein [Kofleriaceae bacterium]
MKPMPGWFRAASYIMAALLAVCVVLQYNDPDPVRWMTMYGAAMLVAAALPTRPKLAPIGFLVAAIALAWGAYLVHDVWGRMQVGDLVGKMSEKGGAVEVGREVGGLAIAGVWLAFASAYCRRALRR